MSKRLEEASYVKQPNPDAYSESDAFKSKLERWRAEAEAERLGILSQGKEVADRISGIISESRGERESRLPLPPGDDVGEGRLDALRVGLKCEELRTMVDPKAEERLRELERELAEMDGGLGVEAEGGTGRDLEDVLRRLDEVERREKEIKKGEAHPNESLAA